jgi:predicted RNA binding protein YcfA (HicA-like mRNA interferase family)
MASLPKILNSVLVGKSDANHRFSEICRLLNAMGFDGRIKGDHHIFHHSDITEILNLQPLPGGKAKPYQVKQIRQIITRYRLTLRGKP